MGLVSSLNDWPADLSAAPSTSPPTALLQYKACGPSSAFTLRTRNRQLTPAWTDIEVKRQMTMTDLETSMATIIAVFQKYSEREGDKHKLKKSELKDLLNDELPDLMTHVKDQATLDSLMESLDTDGDAECDFQEFMTFISVVTVCCHEFFEHEDE
ncbi:protein S100-B-like [Micropterus salmoides]|uniref:protein S100-B-like n=2 Tax=Micropterus salmoides TaxID=27706 RepID=UPI0018ED331A|nr:protein S100-B-like [Micropterus salmoides]XP_045896723.1 protein S100-B [Micropterus dolomieu]XP_045896792.1 protein S100-B [Micropterus dolomieu]